MQTSFHIFKRYYSIIFMQECINSFAIFLFKINIGQSVTSEYKCIYNGIFQI